MKYTTGILLNNFERRTKNYLLMFFKKKAWGRDEKWKCFEDYLNIEQIWEEYHISLKISFDKNKF